MREYERHRNHHPDDLETFHEARRVGHSYRNFNPDVLKRVLKNDGRDYAQQLLEFIESGRWKPVLDNLRKLSHTLLSTDLEILFQRNPDLAEWYEAYLMVEHPSHDHLGSFTFGKTLSDDRHRAIVPDEYHFRPPPFDLDADLQTRVRGAIKSMGNRFQTWTPYAISTFSRGDLSTPIDMTDELLAYIQQHQPIGADIYRQYQQRNTALPREVLRHFYTEMRGGALNEFMDSLSLHHSRLDRDEARMFSRRNPGMMMQMDAYGRLQHLQYAEGLYPHDYPLLTPLDVDIEPYVEPQEEGLSD